MGSGLFHSPRRGAFHRSLTVLVRYRSSAVFSLGPWSAPLPARSRVSGGTHGRTASRARRASPTGLSPAAAARSSSLRLHGAPGRAPCRALPVRRSTPMRHRRQPVPPHRFGLFPVRSPLLGESFLFLAVLRCFSSRGARRNRTLRRPAKRRAGCPIRTSRDRWPPAPPPGISPRGRVLPRPPTPRHPPCAHHRGSRPPRRARGDSGRARRTRSSRRPSFLASASSPPAVPRTAGACQIIAVVGPPRRGRPRARGRARAAHCQGARRRAPPGGAAGSRTPDLRRAKAALSRLSYGPQGRWARLDSNQGPRPYQGRALTG
jgi:hypothetical protein